MAALLVGLLAACAPEGKLFTTSLPTVDADPLPVSVRDLSGLVLSVAPADVQVDMSGNANVTADVSDGKTLLLSWYGGQCDSDELITFWQSETGPTFQLAEHQKLGLGCTAAAISRTVRITLSTTIDPDLIELQVVGG
jgi:hypothetical protein